MILLLITSPSASPNLHACCRLSLALEDPVPQFSEDGRKDLPYECPICGAKLFWRGVLGFV